MQREGGGRRERRSLFSHIISSAIGLWAMDRLWRCACGIDPCSEEDLDALISRSMPELRAFFDGSEKFDE